MSLLTVIQDACDEIGVARPTSVVGSNDVTAIQMFALAKSGLKELNREADWTALTKQHTFVAFASASTDDYALPTDWDRFLPDTFWDVTNRRPALGPMTPPQWQELIRGSLGGAGIDTYFRLIGPTVDDDAIRLWPVRSSSSVVYAFDYITNNNALASNGSIKATFTADGDTPRLDDELLKLWLIWRFKKAKGLPYAEEHLTYMDYLNSAKARNGGSQTLNMGGTALTSVLAVNVQESDFPGS